MAAPMITKMSNVLMTTHGLLCRHTRCYLLAVYPKSNYHKSCQRKASSPESSNELRPEQSVKGKKISQAMKAYLERAKANDDFMADEHAEFEIGKRHLANIMGVDHETFSQADIDRAIEYLFPSGLHDKKARPMMKPPAEVIPPRKAAQFGVDGRPFHHLFYTGKPNFFQLMHNMSAIVDKLKAHEDEIEMKKRDPQKKTTHAPEADPDTETQLTLAGITYFTKQELEASLQEKITQTEYERWISLMNRIVEQPYSAREKSFVSSYSTKLTADSVLESPPEPMTDENGNKFLTRTARRKTAVAEVTIYEKGSGNISINGHGLLAYFPRLVDREQILYPLQLTESLGKFDLTAKVENGGPSGQAGAIRLALSLALQSFVDEKTREMMRLGGLINFDPRKRERKKPGQKRARRKFTWKKR